MFLEEDFIINYSVSIDVSIVKSTVAVMSSFLCLIKKSIL